MLSVQPHKLLGLVAQGEPIERLALSVERGLLASATHDDAVRIWDVSWLADGGASDEDTDEDGDSGNDEVCLSALTPISTSVAGRQSHCASSHDASHCAIKFRGWSSEC